MDDQTSKILSKYPKGHRDCLIPILQEVQEAEGFLSETAVEAVSKYLDIPSSKIFGLATFYNQFRFSARGRYHIRLCNGTSCHVTINSEILKELIKSLRIEPGQTTRDGIFSLELTACMGACHLSPLIQINETYHTQLVPGDIKEILSSYREGNN